jgi:DNA repair protein RadC
VDGHDPAPAAAARAEKNLDGEDPAPSREDLRLTRQLADAATLLDLRLHDHVIIGNGTGEWVSLAQRGKL